MRASFTFRPCSIICPSGPANAGRVAPIASTPMGVTSKFFIIKPLSDCLAKKIFPSKFPFSALVHPPAVPNSQFNSRRSASPNICCKGAQGSSPRRSWAVTACGARGAANDELARPYRTGRFHIASNRIGVRWSNAGEGPRGEYRAYALDESLHQSRPLPGPVTIHNQPLRLPANQSAFGATACGAAEGTPPVPRTSIAAVL